MRALFAKNLFRIDEPASRGIDTNSVMRMFTTSTIRPNNLSSLLCTTLVIALGSCPAVAADAPQPDWSALRVQDVVRAALHQGASALSQGMDLRVQAAQAALARREFLPQGTVTAQAERSRSTSSGEADSGSRTGSMGLESTLKLRTGASVSASVARSSLLKSIDGSGIDSSVTSSAGVSATTLQTTRSVTFTQPLFRGAGVAVATANERLAEIGFSSTQKNFVQSMSAIVLDCVTAYFAVDQAHRSVELAQASLERAAQLHAINESLFAAGHIARTALLQNDADDAAAELALAQARHAEQVAKRRLVSLMGMQTPDPDSVPVNTAESFTSYLNPVIPDEQTTVQRGLAQRADVRIAQDNVSSAQLSRISARDNLRDQLNVYARVDNQSVKTLERSSGTSQAVGVTYAITLDKSSARVAADAAGVAVRKAELALTEAQRNASAEIRDAVRSLSFAIEQQRLAQRSAELTAKRLDNETEKARLGRSSATDLSVAQDSLRQANAQALQAQYAVLQAQLEVQRVTGTVLEAWQSAGLVDALLASAVK
jgi:outer membrane protein TolC